MKLFKKAKKGFTLVELVVVIAVIAILAAVSVGAYFGVTDSANRSKLEQEAKAAYDSIRLVSLADPENNQGLDIDGLHVRNNDQGIPTFQNDLVYTTGIGYTVDDEIPMVDGTPTISGKVIVLRNDVYTESAFSSTAYNTYKSFDYYTDEVGSYFANVNIINGKINILKADFETVTPDPETPVKALGSLKVEGELNKKTYLEGDDIDLTGLTFKAVYSDSTETDVTSSVVVSNSTLELNTTSVTVSYTENNVTKTTSVTGFTVNKVVFQELVVEGGAADTEYFEGESFKLDGLTFYEKNNRGDVDRENPIPHANLTVSPAELTYNTRQVTISYSKDNVTDSYTVDINVQKIVPTKLEVSGELTVKNYFVGETLSLEGLTFTATYNNQTTKNVTSEVTAESLVLASQQEKVIVSYSHNDVTKTCEVTGFTVTNIVADTLTVSGELTKKEYIDGDYINLAGLSFKVTNNDGSEYTLTTEQVATISSEPLSAGDTEVTVTYNANGTEVSCVVSGFTTDGIKVTGLVKEGTLIKDEYFDNETFDPSGLTFYATFNKGERQDVTSDVTFSPLSETITATYVHQTGTVTCQITGITVTKIVPVELKVSDVQTTYYVGDTLETVKTGRTFEVKYNNSDDYTKVDASRVTVSGNVTAGEQTITFSFEDCDTTVTATKTVTFVAITMNDTLTVSGSLSKTNYFAGDTLSLSGLTFTATYNNGNTETVTPIVEGTLTEGQDSATVTYTNEYGTASATVTGFAVTAAPEMQQNVWYKVVNESQIQNGYKLILTYSNKTASSVYSEKYFQLSSTTFENEADGTIQNDNLPNNTIIFDIETTENGFKLNNNGNPLKSNSGDVSYASNATGDYEWYVTTEAGNILLTINDKGTIRYLTYRNDDVASSRIKPYPNTPLVQYDANNQYDVDYIDIYVCSEIVNNPEQGGNEGEQPGINPESPTFAGYEKITSAPDSWDGRYLIVYEDGSNAYVFNGQDAVNGHTKANIENEKFINKTSSLESNEVEIKTVSNGVSLKHANGYLYGKSGENSLNFNTSTSQVNKIEFTDGAVNIESNSTYLRFNNSSNQMRFRYYKSGQQTIQLYKFNGSSTPAPTPTLDSITAEPSNIEIYEGDTYNGTISVKGTYSNGSTETFTSDYTLKSNNTNFVVIEDNKIKGIAAGSTTVEVTYGGKSTELEVTVKAVESGGGNDNYTEQTANISITGSSGTKSSDNNSISWKLDAITITNTKGGTAIRTSDTDHYRVYASSTLKFNSSKGKMKKIVVTCSSGYADDLKNSVGESATISGNVVTIEVDSIELIINITSQTRLTKVEVKYLG